jgi:hypothetical protein
MDNAIRDHREAFVLRPPLARARRDPADQPLRAPFFDHDDEASIYDILIDPLDDRERRRAWRVPSP